MELTATQLAVPDAARRRDGGLLWQRTDTVGTELVFEEPAGARGSAVVAGSPAYATRWNADLGADRSVRALTVTCEGAGWQRTLTIARAAAQDEQDASEPSADGRGKAEDWACHVVVSGQTRLPDPGAARDDDLAGADVLLLADSPMFLTWAVRDLTPEQGPVTRTALRVLVPSLAVVRSEMTFHRINEHRLRIKGAGNATTYDLETGGLVTYQAGRLRIAP